MKPATTAALGESLGPSRQFIPNQPRCPRTSSSLSTPNRNVPLLVKRESSSWLWECGNRGAISKDGGKGGKPGKDRPVCSLGQQGFPPFPSGRHFHSPPRRLARLRLSVPLRLRPRERLEGHLAVLVQHPQLAVSCLLHLHSRSRSQVLIAHRLQLQEAILETHHPVVGDHPLVFQAKHPFQSRSWGTGRWKSALAAGSRAKRALWSCRYGSK